jgi:hypothetical protein
MADMSNEAFSRRRDGHLDVGAPQPAGYARDSSSA